MFFRIDIFVIEIIYILSSNLTMYTAVESVSWEVTIAHNKHRCRPTYENSCHLIFVFF
jgi:hypothetical protein